MKRFTTRAAWVLAALAVGWVAYASNSDRCIYLEVHGPGVPVIANGVCLPYNVRGDTVSYVCHPLGPVTSLWCVRLGSVQRREIRMRGSESYESLSSP